MRGRGLVVGLLVAALVVSVLLTGCRGVQSEPLLDPLDLKSWQCGPWVHVTHEGDVVCNDD